MSTLFMYSDVTLITMEPHGNQGRFLPHWAHMLDLLDIRHVVPYETFVKRNACVGHAIWGIGVKPYWSKQERFHTHAALVYRRLVFRGVPDTPTAPVVYLARTVKDNRELANLKWFLEETGLVAHHASGYLLSQLTFFKNCEGIVGVHGAGLTNVIYMRRPALFEIHGPYGSNSMIYQRMVSGLYGIYETDRLKDMSAHPSLVERVLQFVVARGKREEREEGGGRVPALLSRK